MGNKLTIQDIARLAGVSTATVSRVINQKANVDPETRERILRLMEEHGFVPSLTASGLASGKSRLLGIMAPPLTWPSVSDIISGVAEFIEQTPYEIILYSINPERDHSDVLDRILAMRMTAGLLAIFPGQLIGHLTKLYARGLPIVTIDDQNLPTSIPWIGVDNHLGAYNATRYLLELGHKRIAHFIGPDIYRCSHERYEGYCQAMQEAGITPDPELILNGEFEIVGGRRCADAIFALPPEKRPDAVFAGNDQMAYGFATGAEEYGCRIPEDIALIGFDDVSLARHMKPALTTVRQPFQDMGQVAIQILLSMIDSQYPLKNIQQLQNSQVETKVVSKEGEPMRIQLQTRLIVRESCGAQPRFSVSR